MNHKIATDKSKLLVTRQSTEHYVRIAPGSDEYLKVWIKEPTFLQLEQAQMKLFDFNSGSQEINLDMSEVYRYLWDAFVEKTEPALSAMDVLGLNPYIGNQLKEILPNPFTIMETDEDLKVPTVEQ
tara:strand:+ start:31461 stop:31838 length:378 start_codon:yes stop_codon:yes gene_type:complete